MPNNRRILIPRKVKILLDLLDENKSDDEIKNAIGRPDLDVQYFRDNAADYKRVIKESKPAINS